MIETILIVDDEESVRRTFHEWLAESGIPLKLIAVADAEAALIAANSEPIDLAILDWNLGSGSDGLRLLEDLVEFQPDLVAILITGYAAQATPLDALRKGVRDYLDKNSNLTRETFIAAVRKQLRILVPVKRQREFHASLANFREAVEKVLPLVRGAATLNDPVPLATVVRSLAAFALRCIGARDAVVIVRHHDVTTAYDIAGRGLELATIPFATTLAASALSLQEPSAMYDFASDGITLHSFEKNRASVLAVPINAGANSQVVLELFDKPEFTADDRKVAVGVAEIGAELLRGVLAERQTHRLLIDAVEAAIAASHDASSVIDGAQPPSAPPPQTILDTLRRGLDAGSNSVVDGDLGLDLVAAVRELAVRHGPAAVAHCVHGSQRANFAGRSDRGIT